MDNLKPTVPGRIFAATWHEMGSQPLQMVAVKDIGVFGALAFAKSELDEYKNTAISLAGCDLTQTQAEEIFWKAVGRPSEFPYSLLLLCQQWYMLTEIHSAAYVRLCQQFPQVDGA